MSSNLFTFSLSYSDMSDLPEIDGLYVSAHPVNGVSAQVYKVSSLG